MVLAAPRPRACVVAALASLVAGPLAQGCSPRPPPTPTPSSAPAPVALDPRASARCVARAAGTSQVPVENEDLVGLVGSAEGPQWVSTHGLWSAHERVEHALPQAAQLARGAYAMASLGPSAGVLAALEGRGLALYDAALRAARPVRVPSLPAGACGLTLEEAPGGALVTYYTAEGAGCDDAMATRRHFVLRLRGASAEGAPVPLGEGREGVRALRSARARWESGRVVVWAREASGEAVSVVLDERLGAPDEHYGYVACAEPGCVRFAVLPQGALGAPGNGTLRLDVLGYSDTFVAGIDADEVLEARAVGDMVALVFRGRINGAAAARGLALVSARRRQIETVYDEFRGASSVVWAEDSAPQAPTMLRATARGFALGAGSWLAGTMVHRVLECRP